MPSDYKSICQDNIRRRGEEFDDIGRLISEKLYSDRSHFVYELLQNAEDALERRFKKKPNTNLSCKVKFRLFQDRLEFRHFGAPFNEEDVRGISDVLKGTKKEDIFQIGKHGIGFKSVYAFTASPEIHSGEEHFVIKRYIRPEGKEPISSIKREETVFNFPFDYKELSAGAAFELILKKLRGLGPRVLLFLKRIDEIEWSVEDGERGQYLKETKQANKNENARYINVIGQNNGKDEEESWIIFERPVPVPGKAEIVRVEIGFRLQTEDKAGKKEDHIIKLKDSPLVVYFPTEKNTRLGFLIQGPYITTPSRDNISNDEWNVTLIRETSQLMRTLLPQIKQLGLMTVSFLEAMPIRTDDFTESSMFYPIFRAVQSAFKGDDLLPADDGSFVSAYNAKLSRSADLRKLLNYEQLGLLFQSRSIVKWLTTEITQDRTPDLHNYLIKSLGVEELTPEGFSRKIYESFLDKQTDKWMVSMYKYVGALKALWRPSSGYFLSSDGPLRSKPIIRLQNGTHVKPFKDDGSPNAYLMVGTMPETSLHIVKSELTMDEEACIFLRDLGIPKMDLVEDVIENILPKYKKDVSRISADEHKKDIVAIEKAYTTTSQDKKERLRKRLQETPFIRVDNRFEKHPTTYKTPIELYIESVDLRLYFSGNNEIGFVHPDYGESTIKLFEDIGVKSSIKISRKAPDNHGFVTIKNSHGDHQRGLNKFDPEIHVEGLEKALSSISTEKSKFIWNHIAVHHANCISGTVESSKRQNFEHSAKKNCTSNFGHLLIEKPWLPDKDGGFKKPSDLMVNWLPDSYVQSEQLAQQLGMKLDVVARLAKEVGISTEDIDLVRKYHAEFKMWKEAISVRKEQPLFPVKPVENPERRQERLSEQISDAPEKKYEKRERSIRTTSASVVIDADIWLRNQYTNESDQMICQICKNEMPFRKRNGEHYIEKKEVLSKNYLSKEHVAQHLALCPLCAAMYNEFIKQDETAMDSLRKEILNANNCDIPIKLGNRETSIRFVETHFHDLRFIIRGVK